MPAVPRVVAAYTSASVEIAIVCAAGRSLTLGLRCYFAPVTPAAAPAAPMLLIATAGLMEVTDLLLALTALVGPCALLVAAGMRTVIKQGLRWGSKRNSLRVFCTAAELTLDAALIVVGAALQLQRRPLLDRRQW